MALTLKDKKTVKEKTYIWVGKDKKGKEIKGEMKATSDSLVKVFLRGKGIYVEKIKAKRFNTDKKVKQSDIAIFTRQLATMMKAGVPLLQSFEIVASGHANSGVTKMLLDIRNKVETGSSLSEAFSTHPNHFDKLYCSLVSAGEKAGILESILERLATYQEKITAIKSKLKKAMMYPLVVIAVAFLVTAIIMIFVVPSFEEVFHSFGAELPAPTLIVMAISHFFVNNWYLIFGGIIGSIYIFLRKLKKSIKMQNAMDRMVLKLPIFGEIFRKSSVARWCRTLATMSAAGVPLVEALDSVAGAAGNVVYYNATKNIQKEVSTGQSLTISIQHQQLFPHMMIQMCQIGEESGSLDAMLNKVAEFYEVEVDDSVAALSSLIEPFIMVFLGVVIGGLVVAMYLPIFKMASSV